MWMTCTQIILVITYLLFASAIDGTLYAATALLGICYGVQFSIMIPTISELFGLMHFGIFYNFMSLGNPLGAFFFSGLLAGYIYIYIYIYMILNLQNRMDSIWSVQAFHALVQTALGSLSWFLLVSVAWAQRQASF